MGESGADRISVLHVDDKPEFAELTARSLEEEHGGFEVVVETRASDALERLGESDDVDCIVSGYDMPGRSGIEFLEDVRESYPDLPFILYTGKGSEELASEAISAGVTDYLQKGGDPCQSPSLANRIENAVAQYHAERAVEETERRYRRLIEESTDVITIVDERGRFEYVSPAAERLLGYGAEELEGENGFGYIHPDDCEAVVEQFDDLAGTPGGRATTEFRFEQPDGEWIWLEVRGRNMFDDPAVDGIAVYARDVTERRERKEAVRRERDRFRAVFQEAFDAMLLADDDGRYVDVNESAAELFGLPGSELVGRSMAEFTPEDSEATWRGRRATGGDVGRVPLVRPDGTRRLVEYAVTTNVRPGQYLWILRDITDRKQYEETLHDLHDSIRRLLKAASRTEACKTVIEIGKNVLEQPYSAVFLWDEEDEQLRAEGTSEQALAAFGPPPTYGRGDGLAGYVFETGERLVLDDAQGDPRGLDADSDSDDADGPRGYCVVPMDEFGVVIFASPDVGAFDRTDGELAGILAAHTEIALERIDREQTLRRRERTLERQNERLDEFASVVSHDLRNPLNIATGQLELAREVCDCDPLDVVADAHERMEMLIEGLLALAREGENVSAVDAVDLAEIVVDCWANVETGGATIETDTDSVVLADRVRLQQCFENLIRNAVEHGSRSPGSQARQDAVEHGGVDVTVTVGDLPDGFYVEDDGPGIPPAERDTVFELGYSSSSAGTGIGLSIVEQVVDAFGWDVRVCEGADGGARFEITDIEFADPE